MKNVIIYTLSDPFTKNVRYIGKTNCIKKRLNSHICKSNLLKNTHKNNWIKNLLSVNSKPIIEIIDEVSINEWEFWEKYWIAQFKAWGFKLTNLTDGGDCVISKIKYGNENGNYKKEINDYEILFLIELGLSQKEIAVKLNTNVALIKNRMVKFNINFRKNRGNRISLGDTHNYREDITKEKVLTLFNEGLSINKISKILNTDRSTIKNRLK
jgi:DNA-binding CsgD family transcriptional regulator